MVKPIPIPTFPLKGKEQDVGCAGANSSKLFGIRTTMKNLYWQLVDSIWFRFACMFMAVLLMILVGAMGFGHGGLPSTNLDARFLYVAGLYWRLGGSPYNPASLTEFVPELMDAVE